MFPETKGPNIKCFVIYLNNFIAKINKLYPGRDTFEFDQGRVTKNQPITVLILLSGSLDI